MIVSSWRAAVVLLATLGCQAGAPAAEHVVLVTLDTLRADRLGIYGHSRATSPHLDALAARGVRFDDAIAQAISTPPSHASILTGLNPPSHGLRHLAGQALAPEQVTLAERLRDRGFTTAAFVSGLPLRRASGLDQGFGVYEDSFAEGGGERPAEATNAQVRAWLAQRESPADPVFLWVHYFDPHWPYLPPASFRRAFAGRDVAERELLRPRTLRVRRRRPPAPTPEELRLMRDLYEAEIAYTDAALGELLSMLEDAGILARAIVAVLADHGECLGERGDYFGHWDVFPPTARVPFVIVHPDGRFAGRAVSQTVGTVDLVPTLLAWLGAEPAAGLDGRDLTPLLTGRETAPRAVYAEQVSPGDAFALYRGHWLLRRVSPLAGGGAPRTALFDRRSGSFASPRDVSAAHPEPAAELAGLLGAALAPGAPGRAASQEVPADVAERLEALGYTEAGR